MERRKEGKISGEERGIIKKEGGRHKKGEEKGIIKKRRREPRARGCFGTGRGI